MDDILKNFDAALNVEHIVGWIRKYFANNGNIYTPAVIGISGGKDSTICAALLARALGRDRVIGVAMPQGVQSDLDDAKRVCELYCGSSYVIPIEDMVKPFEDWVYPAAQTIAMDQPSSAVTTNIPPRIRMTILYAIAAAAGGRVCNTSNRSEIYVGYSTKWGDNIGDFGLLREYTVTELYAIGEALGIEEDLLYKAPADGLTGRTDEDNLGFTYYDLDNYLLNEIVPDACSMDIIQKRFQANKHKSITGIPHPNVKR